MVVRGCPRLKVGGGVYIFCVYRKNIIIAHLRWTLVIFSGKEIVEYLWWLVGYFNSVDIKIKCSYRVSFFKYVKNLFIG